MRVFVLSLVVLAVPCVVLAQTTSLHVQVRTGADPVPDADVYVNGLASRSSVQGDVTVAVTPGHIDVVVLKEGFAPATAPVDVPAGQQVSVIVTLTRATSVQEHVTVSATRTDTRLDDQPMRVEVLEKEDLEEEQVQTPGDIVMVLNEKAGLRVQATSPGLGTASIRIQGMRGRYTRVLSDGLPLFGEDVGGLGLLQTPPTDLGQVELIKGVASALYGANALGGVIDLISKRPGAKPQQQLLVNRSSRGATDTVLFATQPLTEHWKSTLLVGGHWQEKTDVDGDRWADIAGYSRAVVRPRFFWDDEQGHSVFATVGTTWEHRTGGTMIGAPPVIIGGPFLQGLNTDRVDAGVVARTLLASKYVLTARGSMTFLHQEHQFGDTEETDQNNTLFGEVSLSGHAPRQTWVGGAAFERDTLTPHQVPAFGYAYNVPGLFGQDEINVARWLAVSGSARVDRHNRFGTFVSPRVSGLVRAGGWTSRASFGTGFFAPTPQTDETEEAGLSRLRVPTPLAAERGQSASWDLTRTARLVSVTASVFRSRIAHPVVLDREDYALTNAAEPTVNQGVELLARLGNEDLNVTGTYTYVHAREGTGSERGDVPLTPRHGVGLVATWEQEGNGRVAFEWFYTGRQHLEDNPFRTQSAPYVLFGVVAERRFGHVRLFINGENLGNVRQTHWDPLLRSARGIDGRWTVDAWAPLDGRVINGGIKLSFP